MTNKSKTLRKIARNAFQGGFFLASCLLLPASSSAQSPVNVTATVKDSAGIPYSNATVSILLIPTGTAPTVGGAQISGTNNGQLDVNGKLNVSLYKNTDIVPASSQWQFTICETPGVAPPLGTGGQCFTSSQTVSAAVDFSTQFQAAAKALTTVTVGGSGSVTHTAGNLTAGNVVIGNSNADVKVDSACVTNGTGGLSGCTSINTPGTVTANIGSFNSVGTNLTDVACAAQSVSNANQDRFYCDGTNWPVVSMNTNAAQKLALSMGVVSYTTSQTLDQSHCGKLVTFNGVSLTATLPAAIINSACQMDVIDLAATSLTIGRNGLNVNGAASNPTALTTGQAYHIVNDGAGYWTTSWFPGSAGTVTNIATSAPITGGPITGTGTIACATCNVLSSLTAGTGSNTIANGNNPQTWNWAQTTDSQNGISFGETSAATGGTLTSSLANQTEVAISTAAGSTASPLKIAQGSVTGTTAFPALQITSTWNNAGLTGEGLLMNITNTASAANSMIADLRVGGVSQLSVDKAGEVYSPLGYVTGTPGATSNVLYTGGLQLANGSRMNWYNAATTQGGSADLGLSRISAGLLAVGNGNASDVSARIRAAGYECLQAADIGAQTANTATYMCPAAVTAWRAAVPAAAPAGIILNSNVAGLVTQSTSGDSNHAVHVTAQTATKTIYTLCPASAGGCNVAGQYRITWYFNQGGTACGTPAPGQVTFEVSWTDNAGAHTTVALPMNDNSSIAVFTSAFKFAASNTTGFASGEFNLWSTGAQPIQVTNTYTPCAVGTGTWELTAAVEQVQ